MFVLIKLLLFLLSSLGLWELIYRKTDINLYYLPSITIAIQVTVLILSGLLNCLNEFAYMIHVSGLGFLFYFTYKDKNFRCFKKYLNSGYLFMLCSLVFLIFLLKGKVFLHYDNFSHWAIVLKPMLYENRLPNFTDKIIMFTQYPLGSSVWVYYFAKFISNKEWIQMLGQNFAIISCILPIFIYCKKNYYISLIFIFLSTNIILFYNIEIVDLRVDSLLPIAGMAMLMFIKNYILAERCQAYLAIPLMIWVLHIKNSGIFFVAIASLIILYQLITCKNYKRFIVMNGLPYFTLFLWQKHCKYVFENAASSKHAMTFSNYQHVFSNKSVNDIHTIVGNFLDFIFNYNALKEMLLLLFISGIIVYIVDAELKNFAKKIFVINLVMIVTYSLGVLAVYMVSMPIGEALRLATIERYVKTILLCSFYTYMVLVVKFLSNVTLKEHKQIISIVSLSCVLMLFYFNSNTFNKTKPYFYPQDSKHVRIWTEKIINEYKLPKKKSYCFIVSDSKNDSGYRYYLCKYLLESKDIVVVQPQKNGSDDLFMKRLNNIKSQYIIISDYKNKNIISWVNKNYPDQKGKNVLLNKKINTGKKIN